MALILWLDWVNLMVMSTRVLCTALKHSQKTSSTLSACMVHNRCDIWFYLVFNTPLKLRELGGGGDGGGGQLWCCSL
jgi:hypothetical protein